MSDKEFPEDEADTIFQKQQDELKAWPYSVFSIDETLDTDLIEGRGKQLLYQAINNRNLVAFVGSGLSQAYGRLSWNDWLDSQLTRIGQEAKAFVDCAEMAEETIDRLIKNLQPEHGYRKGGILPLLSNGYVFDKFFETENEYLNELLVSLKNEDENVRPKIIKNWVGTLVPFLENKKQEIKFVRADVSKLNTTFSNLKAKGDFPNGEKHPIIFQVADKLQQMLLKHEDLLISRAEYHKYLADQKGDSGEECAKQCLLEKCRLGFNPYPRKNSGYKPVIELVNLALCKIEEVRRENPRLVPSSVSVKNAVDFGNFYWQIKCYKKKLQDYSTYALASDLTVSERAKLLLIDECAHAERILEQATEHSDDAGRTKWSHYKKELEDDDQKRRILTLNKTLRSSPLATDRTNLGTAIPTIRRNADRYWALGYFRTESLSSLIVQLEEKGEQLTGLNVAQNITAGSWWNVFRRIEDQLKQNKHRSFGSVNPVDRVFVSPSHRFVLAMLMSLVECPYEIFEGWQNDNKETSNDGYKLFKRVNATDFLSRLSIIDQEQDPLQKLVMKHHVRRFLTTNYDFEIERFFHDRGYENCVDGREIEDEQAVAFTKPDSRREKTDNLGGVLRRYDFDREKASDLITFSIDHHSTDASVFHLHGQATMDSKPVVTERDYMDLYLLNDDHRTIVDESIRVAFSSNPVLFVGLGMNETDVLRPLRHFMSDKDRLTSRTAIVLFAADKPEADRTKWSSTLFLRYGVHTIFYGSGWIDWVSDKKTWCDKANGSSHNVVYAKVDWLHCVMQIIDFISEYNDALTKFAKCQIELVSKRYKEGSDQERKTERSLKQTKAILNRSRFDRICDLQTTLGSVDVFDERDEQSSQSTEKNADALSVLFGLDFSKFNDENEQYSELFETLSDEVEKSVRLERCNFESTTRQYKRATGRINSEHYLKFEYHLIADLFVQALQIGCPDDDHLENLDELNWHLRQCKARKIGLDGVRNSLYTATLSCALDELELERQDWWKHWQLSPPHRVAHLQKPDDDEVNEEVKFPVRYIRHQVEEVITQIDDNNDRLPSGGWETTVKLGSDEVDVKPVTRVRSFDTFLNAVERRAKFDAKRAPHKGGLGIGRRFYFIAAHRGVGKGVIFSALFSKTGLRQYIRSAWANGNAKVLLGEGDARVILKELHKNRAVLRLNRKKNRKIASIAKIIYKQDKENNSPKAFMPNLDDIEFIVKPEYQGSIFINLSFATEISSIIDMTCNALNDIVVRLAEETRDGIAPIEKTELNDLKRELKQLSERHPRRDRLSRLANKFAELSLEACKKWATVENGKVIIPQPRYLACINAVELMNYPDGLVKNRELELLLRMLVSLDASKVPYDLIMTGDENRVSQVLSENTPFAKRYMTTNLDFSPAQVINGNEAKDLQFIPICREEIDLRSIHNLQRRERRCGLDFNSYKTEVENGQSQGSRLKQLKRRVTTDSVCFVHHARMMKPEQLMIDNFLPLAFVLYLKFVSDMLDGESEFDDFSKLFHGEKTNLYGELLARDGEEKKPNVISDLFAIDSKTPPESYPDIADTHEKSQTFRGNRDKKVKVLANNFFEKLIDRIRTSNDLTSFGSRELAKQLRNSSKEKTFPNELRKFLSTCEADRKSSRILNDLILTEELCLCCKDEKNAERLSCYADRIDLLTKFGLSKILEQQGNDDEALYHVLRARYENETDKGSLQRPASREWREIRNILRGNRYCMTILLAAAQRLALSCRSVNTAAEVAEKFIRQTIDHVKFAGIDRKEDVVLQDVLNAYETFHQAGDPVNDVNLHLAILKQLAAIGSPLSIDVLEKTPDIRRYFSEYQIDIERTRPQILIGAMNELTERGLVFRLSPHPRLKELDENLGASERRRYYGEWPPERTYRYALHRLMQRHIVKKIGGGQKEFAEINSFAASLYASMPADVPRVDEKAYAYLRSLVSSLSQYPDHPIGSELSENWHVAQMSVSARVQALRAALSIVRSTFSVAVVSRFEDHDDSKKSLEPPHRGYFEHYRIQVRWLIRKAWELLEKKPDLDKYEPSDEERPHISSFYRDEIVWLYNECGIINYVQGNLYDSTSLLRQASKLNTKIEGKFEGSPQSNRIALNLALVHIERGRLSAAKKRLEEICDGEVRNGGQGRVWYIAHGYLGLIAHLKGNLDIAVEHYKQATIVLRDAYEDRRACSIFLRHHGDLERARKRFDIARNLLHDSVALAEAAGHEDLLKKTRLSVIRLDMDEILGANEKLPLQKFTERVLAIETYARIMEMPALLCETYSVRANLLLEAGEHSLAGYLYSRVILVAKKNGMNLRLNTAITGYARVLKQRNQLMQARRLLFDALEMAKEYKNQLEIERIEAVFESL